MIDPDFVVTLCAVYKRVNRFLLTMRANSCLMNSLVKFPFELLIFSLSFSLSWLHHGVCLGIHVRFVPVYCMKLLGRVVVDYMDPSA